MAYGTVKVDNIVFTNGGVDKTITVSGLFQSTSGDLTLTGTVTAPTIRGTTVVSGATVTGTTGQFTAITGGTAGFTTITGSTITGTTLNVASGNFTGNSTAAAFIPTGATVPTNGLFLPSGNNIGLSTSGAERLRITSSGTLQTTFYVYEQAGQDVVFNASRGTPTAKSAIEGGDRIAKFVFKGYGTSDYGEAALIEVGANDPSGNTVGGNIFFATTADGSSSSTTRLSIDSSGNVGIGTSSPAAPLHVYPGTITGSSSKEVLRIAVPGNTITSTAMGYIGFRGHDISNIVERDVAYIGTKLAEDGSGAPRMGGNLVFGTCPTGASQTPTERMRITSDGKVGIGTSSLDANEFLKVVDPSTGNVIFGDIFEYGAPVLRVKGTASEPDAHLSVRANGTESTNGTGFLSARYTPGTFTIGTYGSPITFEIGLNDERARLTDNGLSFNGDTASANALDDYEEGTFTPTVEGSSTAGTATYSRQDGVYTKIGRAVHFQIYLTWTGGTGVGNLKVDGLPFNLRNDNMYPSFFAEAEDLTLSANHYVFVTGNSNSNNISIDQKPIGTGNTINVAYDSSGNIQINGTYFIG